MSRAELWKPSPSWQKIDLLYTVHRKWQHVERAITETKRLCDMLYLKLRGAEMQIDVLVTFMSHTSFWVCRSGSANSSLHFFFQLWLLFYDSEQSGLGAVKQLS